MSTETIIIDEVKNYSPEALAALSNEFGIEPVNGSPQPIEVKSPFDDLVTPVVTDYIGEVDHIKPDAVEEPNEAVRDLLGGPLKIELRGWEVARLEANGHWKQVAHFRPGLLGEREAVKMTRYLEWRSKKAGRPDTYACRPIVSLEPIIPQQALPDVEEALVTPEGVGDIAPEAPENDVASEIMRPPHVTDFIPSGATSFAELGAMLEGGE